MPALLQVVRCDLAEAIALSEADLQVGFFITTKRQTYLTKKAASASPQDFGTLISKENFGAERQNYVPLPNL